MDNELCDLCKQVYEKTGWKTGKHIWSVKNPKVCGGDNFMDGMSFALYDSDFLLEKLRRPPMTIQFDFGTKGVTCSLFDRNDVYTRAVSTTPRKALLKLTLALADAGELKETSK